MTFEDLVERVIDGLQNDEASFIAHIPEFVRAAEEDVLNKVEIFGLRKYQTTNLVSGAPTFNFPSDFVAPYTYSVYVGSTYRPLSYKDEAYIREAFPNPSETGIPRVYALLTPTVGLMAPAPATSYPSVLSYYYRPASLVESPSTWLGDNAERALEFGTKIYAAIYSKFDEDIIAAYKMQFDNAIQDIERIGYGRVRRDAFRGGDS